MLNFCITYAMIQQLKYTQVQNARWGTEKKIILTDTNNYLLECEYYYSSASTLQSDVVISLQSNRVHKKSIDKSDQRIISRNKLLNLEMTM